MRSYSMSFGMNTPLVDFRMQTDEAAKQHAIDNEAEYCVRTNGFGGGSKYTILAYRPAAG